MGLCQCSTQAVNHFPNKPWFLHVSNTSLLKTPWEKEKLLATSNFSFSHCVFYPIRELSAIFMKFEIVICKLFQFGRVWNLSFGKELRKFHIMKKWLISYDELSCPARVAQWWACRTHDLVVVSSIPGWSDFSFASHLCRSMWEK